MADFLKNFKIPTTIGILKRLFIFFYWYSQKRMNLSTELLLAFLDCSIVLRE